MFLNLPVLTNIGPVGLEMDVNPTISTFTDITTVTFSGATDGDEEDYPLIYFVGVRIFGINIWLAYG